LVIDRDRVHDLPPAERRPGAARRPLSVPPDSVADMVAWQEIAVDAPEFAARVRALFQSRKHKTMATLRADGSPRISGIETQIGEQVTFGSMADSRKLADLRRDPRLALHSPSVDPPEDDPGGWIGEAKISGRAVPTEDGFRVDITEVALTYLDGGLVIESWHPVRGHARRARD
jgi:hypothetical protein